MATKGYGRHWDDPLNKEGRKAPGERVNAHVRSFQEVYDLASAKVAKAVGDSNVVGVKPQGHCMLEVIVVSGVGLGSATLAFGTKADPAKYGAAKAYGSTADVKVEWTAAAMRAGQMSTDQEEILMTIGGAALPSAGTLVVEFKTTARN